MSRDLIKYNTKSDHGESVSYTITPVGASKGARMIPRLMPVATPLLRIFSGIDASGVLGTLSKGGLDTGLEDLLVGVTGDLASVAADAVLEFSQALINAGDDRLLKDILEGITRTSNGKVLRVDDDHSFDVAYMANYGELIVILTQVIKANYWQSLKRLFAGKKF
jgi:hypothetical protein